MEPLSDTLRVELRRFGSVGDLAALVDRWPTAVGDGVARNAWPSRLGRDGTLFVNTSDSVWAFELSHRGQEIAARLGVPGIRFAPGPLALSEPVEVRSDPPLPSPETLREAAALASPIADENLRKTLEHAIALGLAAARDRRPL